MTSSVKTFGTFVQSVPRFLFFTGKGGVGKTTLSCAVAVALADSGRRVLLISTDPASNLREVLGAELSGEPKAVEAGFPLYALNIDPEQAARTYRDRVLAPYRGVFSEEVVAGIAEQLSGACTTEIAAFNEFSRYLGQPASTAEYDHVVFDTAPTGHTLRLLALPAAWTQFLDSNSTGTSCLGPLSGLGEQRALYAETLRCLKAPERTRVVLVSRAEPSALAEAERTRFEFAGLGLTGMHLFLNGLLPSGGEDPVARSMAVRQRRALLQIPKGLSKLPRSEFLLQPDNILGIDALRRVATPGPISCDTVATPEVRDLPPFPPLSALVNDIEGQGRGLVLVMGKGGVGKTTVAAAIAAELASRGHSVHLSTTDPAAHLEYALREKVPGLHVGRIDPKAETALYANEIMRTAGSALDEAGRKLLEEDLRSPCTEEIAVFRAFADQVDKGQTGFVVLDTAPTGHTLLLLDAAKAYHREISRTQGDLPNAVRRLLPRLRDPEFTKVILVTLPEATPVQEAVELERDLARAGIVPFCWGVNQSLTPLDLTHPLLSIRRANEAPFLDEVREHATRFVVIPWLTREPTGVMGLRQLTDPSEGLTGRRCTVREETHHAQV